MASAVFSMENGRLARSGEANPPPPPQPPLLARSGLRHPAANARAALQPRLSLTSSSSSSSSSSFSSAFSSSSSSSSSSPPSSLASSSRNPSMIRLPSPARGSRSSSSSSNGISSSSSSTRASSARVSGGSGGSGSGGGSGSSGGGGGGGGGGGISGVWASILSLGASAFPASLTPISLATPGGSGSSGGGGGSGGSPSPRHPRRYAAVAPAGVRETRVALSLVSSRSSSSSSSSPPPLITGGVSVGEGIERSAAAAAAVVGVGVGNGNAGSGAVEDGGARVAEVAAAAVAAPAAEAPAAAGGELEVPPAARRGPAENAFVVGTGTLTGEGGAAVAGSASISGRTTGAALKVYLEGGSSVYTCCMCRAHLATRDHVISECFHGHGGRAFLFERCVNVTAGRPEERRLLTGMHVVADITCSACGADLGWKYEEAAEKSQKYKEGKFILERCAVTRENCGGSDRFGSDRFGSDGFGSDRFESSRFGSDRCGSNNIVGWGSENAPFADSARW